MKSAPPKLQPIHDQSGNIIGMGTLVPGALLGLSMVPSCLVIVDAWIGKNGAIESSNYSGSICDKCSIDRRKVRRSPPQKSVDM
jgi:hypothetical protein